MFQDISQNASQVSQNALFSVQERLGTFLDGLKIENHPFFFLDILLVALLIYWFWILIRQTRAVRILWGIIILAILLFAGQVLNLTTLNWILKYLLTMLIVAIPVVFQPELRAALERIGRTKFMGDFTHFSKAKAEEIIDEIVDAVELLKHGQVGALIIIRRNDSLAEYLNSGVELNAKVSKEVLLSIFAEKSPLHDGATLISGNTITHAALMLPIDSEAEDYQLGARHKAGVGITRISDAIAIIVSQERRTASLAIEGKIEPDLESEELKFHLLNQLTKKIQPKPTVIQQVRQVPTNVVKNVWPNQNRINYQGRSNQQNYPGGKK